MNNIFNTGDFYQKMGIKIDVQYELEKILVNEIRVSTRNQYRKIKIKKILND